MTTKTQRGPVQVPQMHVGSGMRIGPVTAFPIWTSAPLTERSYTTDMAAGEVAELEPATVERLRVTNTGEQPLLVLSGTLLTGGWQHRMVIGDVLVGRQSTSVIDVACVERGRWGGEREQSREWMFAPSRVRSTAAMSPAQGRQGMTWSEVDRYESVVGRSDTASLVNALRRHDESDDRALRRSAPLPAQRGVVIAVGGLPIAIEVFDHPQTLEDAWQALLRSSLADARAMGVSADETPAQAARDLVKAVGHLGAKVLVGENGEMVHLSAINPHHPIMRAG